MYLCFQISFSVNNLSTVFVKRETSLNKTPILYFSSTITLSFSLCLIRTLSIYLLEGLIKLRFFEGFQSGTDQGPEIDIGSIHNYNVNPIEKSLSSIKVHLNFEFKGSLNIWDGHSIEKHWMYS